MTHPRVTRRDLMAGAGVVLAGGLFGLRAVSERREQVAGGSGATIILQGGRQPVPAGVLRKFGAAGALVIHLEADPVRQWRGRYAGLLAARNTCLVGASTWPQFLLVRGLAEESGRRVRYQGFEPSSGVFVWQIA